VKNIDNKKQKSFKGQILGSDDTSITLDQLDIQKVDKKQGDIRYPERGGKWKDVIEDVLSEPRNQSLKIRGSKQEIYCSVDIEADGKAPGLSNLLSFATAAFDIDKNLIGTFEANLELLDNAVPHPDTMAWWNSSEANKAAYAKTRENLEKPLAAFNRYVEWLAKLPGRSRPVLGSGHPPADRSHRAGSGLSRRLGPAAADRGDPWQGAAAARCLSPDSRAVPAAFPPGASHTTAGPGCCR
jgi:hypothetical protein